MNTIILNFNNVALTDDQVHYLRQANEILRLELNAKGELLIMPPIGGKIGNYEADLIANIGIWNEPDELGEVFSSSTIFRLPDGGSRSPDVAWIKQERSV